MTSLMNTEQPPPKQVSIILLHHRIITIKVIVMMVDSPSGLVNTDQVHIRRL